MKHHAEAVKKKYSDNVKHINSNREVQTIFNKAFMNFMDNKKARKKKSAKRSAKELKNFEELNLDESEIIIKVLCWISHRQKQIHITEK